MSSSNNINSEDFKGLRYILLQYPAEERKSVLNSFAAYGLRSLLSAYRLDELLKGVDVVYDATKPANEDLSGVARTYIKQQRSRALQSSNSQGNQSTRRRPPPSQELLRHQAEMTSNTRAHDALATGGIFRPDVLAKHPFTDDGQRLNRTSPSTPYHHLAKREIRRLAERAFSDYKTSAHGIRVKDMGAALEALFGRNSGEDAAIPQHVVLAIAEEALPIGLRRAVIDESTISAAYAPSMASFGMNLEDEEGKKCVVSRADAAMDLKVWLHVVSHVVRRLWQLEGSGGTHLTSISRDMEPDSIPLMDQSNMSALQLDERDNTVYAPEHHFAQQHIEYSDDEQGGGEGAKRVNSVKPWGLRKRRSTTSARTSSTSVPKKGTAPAGMHGVTKPPHQAVLQDTKTARRKTRGGVPSKIGEQVTALRAQKRDEENAISNAALAVTANQRLRAYVDGDNSAVGRGNTAPEQALDIADAFLNSDLMMSLAGGEWGAIHGEEEVERRPPQEESEQMDEKFETSSVQSDHADTPIGDPEVISEHTDNEAGEEEESPRHANSQVSGIQSRIDSTLAEGASIYAESYTESYPSASVSSIARARHLESRKDYSGWLGDFGGGKGSQTLKARPKAEVWSIPVS